jgi:hypothetical protein
MHVDRRLLGWGVFFVLLGAIPLAVRGGVLDEGFVARWPALWPLLLVGWGLGLLLRRTPVEVAGGAIAAITFGIMGGGLIATGVSGFPAVGCGDSAADLRSFQAKSGPIASGDRLSVAFDCGRLDVTSADGSEWRVEGSDRDGVGPVADVNGSRVTIKQPSDANGFQFGRGNEWHVTVPRSPTIDFGVTLNAGEGTLDLSGAHLGAANLTLNAGSITYRMADAAALASLDGTVNAGSATISLPTFNGPVNLSLNAGSLDVCVPAGGALRVRWSGALGSQNFDALGLAKGDGDVWTTPGFDGAASRIDMRVSANAGSFTLKIGGTCGA